MVIDFVFDELEFGSALKEVKKHCLTEQGIDFFNSLKFYTDVGEIAFEQRRFFLFSKVIESGKQLNWEGGKKVSLPDFFSPNFSLSPYEVIVLYKNYISSESIYRTFYQFEEFREFFKEFKLLPDFKNVVRKTFEFDGSFKENATKRLSSLFKELKKVETNIKTRLNKILEKYKDYVFESIITTRNERFVIPINKNFKGRFECLVHDFSSSGATAYVEPIEIVELNNSLIEIKGSIEEEKKRILAELTKVVIENKNVFKVCDFVVGYFDSLNARYRFLKEYNLTMPEVRREGGLFFRSAAHPLILFSGDKVVRNDVELNERKRILIVSGSNTGGKTVFLKMAGLLVLMCQCVIPVPVEEGSFFSPFSDILTDIGDRQDISQSLSTFSSHLTRINLILNRANSSSLVLIDELGTGTEPADGAAIAMGVVHGLIKRGAFAILTTHHQDISSLSFEYSFIRLASVEFNKKTLSPTYKLIYDVPGLSHAIDIAERLGLPEDFINIARDYSKKSNKDYSSLIAELSEKVKRYRELIKEGEKLKEELLQRKRMIEDKEKKVNELKRLLSRDLKREFNDFIDSFRKEKEKLLHGIKGELRKKADNFEKGFESEFRKKFYRRIEESGEKDEEKDVVPFQKGDVVRHNFLGIEGRVEEVSGRKVLIVSRGKRMWVSEGDIEFVKRIEKKCQNISISLTTKERLFPLEVNLVGKRVEEAVDILDRELDRAILEGFEKVRIIHGHGTGRLKRGIRSYLGTLSFVKRIESDSNDAATIVSL